MVTEFSLLCEQFL